MLSETSDVTGTFQSPRNWPGRGCPNYINPAISPASTMSLKVIQPKGGGPMDAVPMLTTHQVPAWRYHTRASSLGPLLDFLNAMTAHSRPLKKPRGSRCHASTYLLPNTIVTMALRTFYHHVGALGPSVNGPLNVPKTRGARQHQATCRGRGGERGEKAEAPTMCAWGQRAQYGLSVYMLKNQVPFRL